MLPVTGWTTRRCESPGPIVACPGTATSQLAPSAVTTPVVKLTGVRVRFEIVTVCDPGDSAFTAPVKSNPEGCTIGPGFVPAGNTFSTTIAICGELSAKGESISTWP